MTPGPADEARRALREARERAAQGPDPASSPGGEPAGQDVPRPGDIAREALRKAVSGHRGSGRGDGQDPEEDTRGAGTAPEPSAPERSREAAAGPAPAEDRTGAQEAEAPSAGHRAADIAREALRATRDDARRAREETEREGARRRRRARQKAVDERAAAARRARDHGVGEGAPDVRRLLSDAFRMPDLPDARDVSDLPGVSDRSDASDAPDLAELPDVPAGPEETPSDLDERNGLAASAAAPTPETSAPATPAVPATDAPQPTAPTAPAAPIPPTRVSGPAHSASPAMTAPGSTASRTAPRSMAAPGRDGDLRRTFPPFPPREGDRFAESWWGNAWVGALEQGALDVKRLERGRGYAAQGHVDAITVTPGLVLAYVQGSRPRPYRVQVRLRTLDDSDWDRFLDAAADRPGHIAALLDKEMPHSLAECGVPLLPGPGDLEPRCSCPDRGHPCKHAAALCYQTARLLDADPFVLLLLRGRGERDLLDALSRLSATRAARAARDKAPAPLPGVRAAEVLASRALAPLPSPLPPPAHPEQPPAYPAAPGGPDPFALDQLATDAAARAHALLGTGRDPVGQLTFWQDAVRLAAARPGAGLTAGTRSLYASLASAAGRTPSELARAVAAWRQGGLEGLAVLEEPWDPPAGRFDRARPLLLAADLPAFRPWRNHLTHPRGHLQLRLGRDGLWYAYESEPDRDDWWPRGTPDLDPVGALTGLGLPSDL
ncbi:SWIM zinc finger family protein [Streptomyces paradoxus]|uniref:Putative Zn finger protein n=1 Tax=Streptomyces paradoxus TaxID=66375 RepID=A0A7W9T6A3_9ACTN|nr:SWIM zinc finger family protein [Streptomyces paradoxus]MBB6074813.1 putative Zn finger protein [Streptomyces paradoxus]